MSSVQVSMTLFEFIHLLNNFSEPDAAYGAWPVGNAVQAQWVDPVTVTAKTRRGTLVPMWSMRILLVSERPFRTGSQGPVAVSL